MLSSISNLTGAGAAYTAQSSLSSQPKIPTALKSQQPVDVYQRADGSEALRSDVKMEEESISDEKPESDRDKQFRELLHQFVGQVLFGQMLKSMRATQEKNPYFHGGQAEEIFQTQLDMVLTDEMTKSTSKTLSDPMFNLMKVGR